MVDFEDEYRLGRITHGDDLAAVSNRIGPSGSRTFHCNFSSVKIGGKSSAAGAINYLAREGEYADREDLEYVAGDDDEVERQAELIDKTARIRNGSNAERVLVTGVFELPAELDQAQRAEIANLVVADWADRGHAAVAAVHANGKVQPHVHIAVAARPIAGDVIDRSTRLMVGKAALREERHRVGKLINSVVGRDFFNGGRHIDVGIDRKPKKRLPESVYRRQVANPFSEHERAMYALKKAEERRLNKIAAVRKSREKNLKAWRKIDKLKEIHGLIDQEEKARAVQYAEVETRRGWQKLVHSTEDQLATTSRRLREAKAAAVRPNDQEPATYKQIKYLEDLARQTNRPMPEDFIMDRGKVGKVIKRLEKELQNVKNPSSGQNRPKPRDKGRER